MSTVVSRLLGGGSFRMPTAALASFRLPVGDWASVSWGSAELRSLTLSRDLLNAGYGSDAEIS